MSAALAYEPFGLADSPAQMPLFTLGGPRPVRVRSRIWRTPTDGTLARHLSELKALSAEGWDVTAVLAPDSRSVVCLAVLAEAEGAEA